MSMYVVLYYAVPVASSSTVAVRTVTRYDASGSATGTVLNYRYGYRLIVARTESTVEPRLYCTD